jgi:serine/threonine-protein kinase
VDITTADPLIGQLFDGRYRVDARVARGGMATVYTGFDTRLDRVVAIKVMHQALAEDDAFVARFHREAKSAARLSHPNVVAIFDQGSDAGRVFLVMEHVDGGTLRERLREEGRLSPAAALATIEPVLQALAAAHDAGLVHRDVKPENILISSDGRVKVADFGLARAVEATSMTTTGLLIGTVSYLAPEQVSTGRADERSDLYAAGIVLFELLTGAPPYDGDTPLSIAYRHVNDSVPLPSSLLRGVPREVDDVVAAATQRDPAHRAQSARELLVAVRRAQHAVSKAGATTALRPLEDAPTVITPLPEKARKGHATRVLGWAPAGGHPAPPAGPKRTRRRPSKRLVVWALMTALFASAAGLGLYFGYQGKTPKTAVTAHVQGARAQAEKTLKNQGFKPVAVTQAFDENVPPDEVISQSPAAGQKVTFPAAATLVVSKGPERVAVPPLAGKTQADAEAALTAARLRPNPSQAFNDTVAKGVVISVEKTPAVGLKPDARVSFVVSNGPQPINVPVVLGKTSAVATKMITDAHLKPVTSEDFSTTVAQGLVASQTPPSGTLFKDGEVKLVISKGPPLVAVPYVVGLRRTAAFERLKKAGFAVSFIDYPGQKGKRVQTQFPGSGTMKPMGSTVSLYML